MKKTAILVLILTAFSAMGASYSWQKPHATVLPNGELEWAPEPFKFERGNKVRYIDYENGSDDHDGQTQATAWKHHPWDKNATGNAAACEGVHTYVFKRGVIYRGALKCDESGNTQDPIRLTSDPDWGGDAPAVIAGSYAVRDGWKRCSANDAPKGLPEPGKVWVRDVKGRPRPWNIWMTDADGAITRIKLARSPNWEEVDPDDRKIQWWSWPHGKHGKSDRKDGQTPLTKGVSKEHLTYPKGALDGAFVYPEWGPVMGTPAAREIVAYEPEKNTIYFKGFWGGGPDGHFGTMRFYLENSPYFLDEPGEWWLDEKGNRLYIRLPDDTDPNGANVEIARHGRLIEMESGTSNLDISGLAFRFTNQGNPSQRPFDTERDVACIYMLGSGANLNVHHCRFEHINRGIKLKAAGEEDYIDRVAVNDNVFSETDHGAITVADGVRWAVREPPMGQLGHVDILRNKLYKIGQRPLRGEHGHAVDVRFPETAEIAGNFLYRGYGAGLFIWGGKPSGFLGEAPLTRILIHHNKVVDPLLNSNDWGGIETWQGGPHYVFNNISGNPGGYWFWNKRHFGFAYYLDGAFKNFHFNNIAWGKYNEGPHRNTSAFQEIHSYQNTFFHNTIYNFAAGTRRQRPDAGRDKFLANVWQDISEWVYYHTTPAGSPEEANVAHAGEESKTFAYEKNAYANNVYYNITGKFGSFEANGYPHDTLESFQEAMRKRGAMAYGDEIMSETPLLRDPAEKDFRLTDDAPARDHGVKVFVPWALYRTVGEWHFTRNNVDPGTVIDEHWYMQEPYDKRDDYFKMPMFPLKAEDVEADDYMAGDLEDWAPGALAFNGRRQLVMQSNLGGLEPYDPNDLQMIEAADWLTVICPKEAAVGRPFKVELRTKGVPEDEMITAHLHWLKRDSWGGFNAWGGNPVPLKDPAPYVFEFTPEDHPDLEAFSLLIYTSPDGDHANQTRKATVRIPKSDAPPAIKTGSLRTADMDRNNFLIEAYFKTTPGIGKGFIAMKMGRVGYGLYMGKDGGVRMLLADKNNRQTSTETRRVADGKWHHVIAEVDRYNDEVRMYVDGKLETTDQLRITESLANEGLFTVGREWIGLLDFLRVSRGTLADAKTDIRELYAWQFDGPFLKDWTGERPRDGRRDAGAIEFQ